MIRSLRSVSLEFVVEDGSEELSVDVTDLPFVEGADAVEGGSGGFSDLVL